MNTQNPARTAAPLDGGECVQPGGPLPGEVQRGGIDFSNWQARVYEHGRWWRYEVRMPSGGGWHSKGYRTSKGATLALRAALKRKREGRS